MRPGFVPSYQFAKLKWQAQLVWIVMKAASSIKAGLILRMLTYKYIGA